MAFVFVDMIRLSEDGSLKLAGRFFFFADADWAEQRCEHEGLVEMYLSKTRRHHHNHSSHHPCRCRYQTQTQTSDTFDSTDCTDLLVKRPNLVFVGADNCPGCEFLPFGIFSGN